MFNQNEITDTYTLLFHVLPNKKRKSFKFCSSLVKWIWVLDFCCAIIISLLSAHSPNHFLLFTFYRIKFFQSLVVAVVWYYYLLFFTNTLLFPANKPKEKNEHRYYRECSKYAELFNINWKRSRRIMFCDGYDSGYFRHWCVSGIQFLLVFFFVFKPMTINNHRYYYYENIWTSIESPIKIVIFILI